MDSRYARKFKFSLLICTVIILVGIYISLTNGTFDLTVRDIVQTLLRIDPQDDHDLVIFDFRLPRIVIGALVGFGLGIAGAVIQGVTRNPLADPGILGINAGAGAAVVIYMFLVEGQIKGADWFSVITMPLFGWIGGLAAVGLIYLFAVERGALDPQRFVLVGIAIASGFGALTLYVSLKMNPRDYEMAVVWLAGSVYHANWNYVLTALPWLVILTPLIWRKARILDLFQLQEASTKGLGVAADKERRLLLLYSVGLVSACISVAGSVGFIGLIAPHMARRLVGYHHNYMIPLCGMIGMAMAVIGDLIGKTVFAPAQLPVGIVISIIGVPYFIYLLFRARK
ncbi:FecCD family ABC transporter permease [Paenibacillus senegalensis]|uniref:FecCD family ABC transporter permease n=1 Tax=Paenibacillus senegalensis TaxID=1465766 RepID=UPI00028A1A26|nr:iron ABC transporter permease [Paenibacillus senegalensis]